MITMRFNAIVAWASFEIPPKIGPRYRAGIEFIDADADASTPTACDAPDWLRRSRQAYRSDCRPEVA